MSNWIEEAAEELAEDTRLAQGQMTDRKAAAKDIILSHAPVIDAHKIAWAIKEAGHISIFEVDKVGDIITSSIDLNITWVDGRAEWGIFTLIASHYPDSYNWFFEISVVYLNKRQDIARDASLEDKESAQQACEQALRSIVCGVKS